MNKLPTVVLYELTLKKKQMKCEEHVGPHKKSCKLILFFFSTYKEPVIQYIFVDSGDLGFNRCKQVIGQ